MPAGAEVLGPAAPARWTFGALAAEIRARRPPQPPGPSGPPGRVVAIDGRSGAGKTTFGQHLSAVLGSPLLSTDDLVPGWDGLAASVRLLTDGILRPLAQGRPARWQRYDWRAGAPGPWVDVPPAPVLVVEGCGVGTFPAASYLSFLVWIDTPYPVRRQRLEAREDWPTYRPYAAAWARQEHALQRPAGTAARADLVVLGASAALGTGAAAGAVGTPEVGPEATVPPEVGPEATVPPEVGPEATFIARRQLAALRTPRRAPWLPAAGGAGGAPG